MLALSLAINDYASRRIRLGSRVWVRLRRVEPGYTGHVRSPQSAIDLVKDSLDVRYFKSVSLLQLPLKLALPVLTSAMKARGFVRKELLSRTQRDYSYRGAVYPLRFRPIISSLVLRWRNKQNAVISHASVVLLFMVVAVYAMEISHACGALASHTLRGIRADPNRSQYPSSWRTIRQDT